MGRLNEIQKDIKISYGNNTIELHIENDGIHISTGNKQIIIDSDVRRESDKPFESNSLIIKQDLDDVDVKVEEHIEEAEEKFEEIDESIESVQQQTTQTGEKLSEHIIDNIESFTSLESDISSTKEIAESAISKTNELENDISGIENDIENLNSTTISLQDDINTVSDDISHVKIEINAVKTDVSDVNNDVKNIHSDINVLGNEISEVNNGVSKNKEKIASVEASTKDNKEKITSIQKDVNKNTSKISHTNDKLSGHIVSNDKEFTNINKKINDITDSTKGIQSAKRAYDILAERYRILIKQEKQRSPQRSPQPSHRSRTITSTGWNLQLQMAEQEIRDEYRNIHNTVYHPSRQEILVRALLMDGYDMITAKALVRDMLYGGTQDFSEYDDCI